MMELINGDCLEVLPTLERESIDLVVTSPPYDNLRNYNKELEWNFDIFKQVAEQLYDILKMGGVVVWVVNDATINGSETGTSFNQALYFKEIGFKLHDTMIYAKKNPIPLNHNRYEQSFEYMFILTKGKPYTFNPIRVLCKRKGEHKNYAFHKTDDDALTRFHGTVRDKKIHKNIFEYGIGGGNYGHPAIFPLQLAKDQILSWSNQNDTILDPFMGSGTTGVACLQTNRDFIGIEKVEKYYDIAKQRINEANEQKKLV